MMIFKKALACAALAGTFALAAPTAVYADGAASTRNILLLGGAAAAYLIIQHNRKVHERYAEDAQKQAALEQENNDAWAAYQQEQRAYKEEVAVNRELQKEVAYQHNVVQGQQRQLADMHVQSNFTDHQVAMTSYGWGQL